ncbi:hypothetical protein GEMRC1_010394 [Eukaryota sp. GEM-RC1]
MVSCFSESIPKTLYFLTSNGLFLTDVSSAGASSLVIRYPQRFNFNLNDQEWVINMRLRLGLWRNGLLQQSKYICSASKHASFHHIVNCPEFIQMRSVLHNSIRDQCLSLFKSNGFHGKIELLLSAFSDSFIRDKSRDLIGPCLNCEEVVLDSPTVDPCNDTASSKTLYDPFHI